MTNSNQSKLIADLLAALEQIVRYADGSTDPGIVRTAREAIAKAALHNDEPMSKRKKLYDRKCHELAEHFLSDEPFLNTKGAQADLAAEIQRCVEDWIEFERRAHETAL